MQPFDTSPYSLQVDHCAIRSRYSRYLPDDAGTLGNKRLPTVSPKTLSYNDLGSPVSADSSGELDSQGRSRAHASLLQFVAGGRRAAQADSVTRCNSQALTDKSSPTVPQPRALATSEGSTTSGGRQGEEDESAALGSLRLPLHTAMLGFFTEKENREEPSIGPAPSPVPVPIQGKFSSDNALWHTAAPGAYSPAVDTVYGSHVEASLAPSSAPTVTATTLRSTGSSPSRGAPESRYPWDELETVTPTADVSGGRTASPAVSSPRSPSSGASRSPTAPQATTIGEVSIPTSFPTGWVPGGGIFTTPAPSAEISGSPTTAATASSTESPTSTPSESSTSTPTGSSTERQTSNPTETVDDLKLFTPTPNRLPIIDITSGRTSSLMESRAPFQTEAATNGPSVGARGGETGWLVSTAMPSGRHSSGATPIPTTFESENPASSSVQGTRSIGLSVAPTSTPSTANGSEARDEESRGGVSSSAPTAIPSGVGGISKGVTRRPATFVQGPVPAASPTSPPMREMSDVGLSLEPTPTPSLRNAGGKEDAPRRTTAPISPRAVVPPTRGPADGSRGGAFPAAPTETPFRVGEPDKKETPNPTAIVQGPVPTEKPVTGEQSGAAQPLTPTPTPSPLGIGVEEDSWRPIKAPTSHEMVVPPTRGPLEGFLKETPSPAPKMTPPHEDKPDKKITPSPTIAIEGPYPSESPNTKPREGSPGGASSLEPTLAPSRRGVTDKEGSSNPTVTPVPTQVIFTPTAGPVVGTREGPLPPTPGSNTKESTAGPTAVPTTTRTAAPSVSPAAGLDEGVFRSMAPTSRPSNKNKLDEQDLQIPNTAPDASGTGTPTSKPTGSNPDEVDIAGPTPPPFLRDTTGKGQTLRPTVAPAFAQATATPTSGPTGQAIGGTTSPAPIWVPLAKDESGNKDTSKPTATPARDPTASPTSTPTGAISGLALPLEPTLTPSLRHTDDKEHAPIQAVVPFSSELPTRSPIERSRGNVFSSAPSATPSGVGEAIKTSTTSPVVPVPGPAPTVSPSSRPTEAIMGETSSVEPTVAPFEHGMASNEGSSSPTAAPVLVHTTYTPTGVPIEGTRGAPFSPSFGTDGTGPTAGPTSLPTATRTAQPSGSLAVGSDGDVPRSTAPTSSPAYKSETEERDLPSPTIDPGVAVTETPTSTPTGSSQDEGRVVGPAPPPSLPDTTGKWKTLSPTVVLASTKATMTPTTSPTRYTVGGTASAAPKRDSVPEDEIGEKNTPRPTAIPVRLPTASPTSTPTGGISDVAMSFAPTPTASLKNVDGEEYAPKRTSTPISPGTVAPSTRSPVEGSREGTFSSSPTATPSAAGETDMTVKPPTYVFQDQIPAASPTGGTSGANVSIGPTATPTLRDIGEEEDASNYTATPTSFGTVIPPSRSPVEGSRGGTSPFSSTVTPSRMGQPDMKVTASPTGIVQGPVPTASPMTGKTSDAGLSIAPTPSPSLRNTEGEEGAPSRTTTPTFPGTAVPPTLNQVEASRGGIFSSVPTATPSRAGVTFSSVPTAIPSRAGVTDMRVTPSPTVDLEDPLATASPSSKPATWTPGGASSFEPTLAPLERGMPSEDDTPSPTGDPVWTQETVAPTGVPIAGTRNGLYLPTSNGNTREETRDPTAVPVATPTSRPSGSLASGPHEGVLRSEAPTSSPSATSDPDEQNLPSPSSAPDVATTGIPTTTATGFSEDDVGVVGSAPPPSIGDTTGKRQTVSPTGSPTSSQVTVTPTSGPTGIVDGSTTSLTPVWAPLANDESGQGATTRPTATPGRGPTASPTSTPTGETSRIALSIEPTPTPYYRDTDSEEAAPSRTITLTSPGPVVRPNPSPFETLPEVVFSSEPTETPFRVDETAKEVTPTPTAAVQGQLQTSSPTTTPTGGASGAMLSLEPTRALSVQGGPDDENSSSPTVAPASIQATVTPTGGPSVETREGQFSPTSNTNRKEVTAGPTALSTATPSVQPSGSPTGGIFDGVVSSAPSSAPSGSNNTDRGLGVLRTTETPSTVPWMLSSASPSKEIWMKGAHDSFAPTAAPTTAPSTTNSGVEGVSGSPTSAPTLESRHPLLSTVFPTGRAQDEETSRPSPTNTPFGTAPAGVTGSPSSAPSTAGSSFGTFRTAIPSASQAGIDQSGDSPVEVMPSPSPAGSAKHEGAQVGSSSPLAATDAPTPSSAFFSPTRETLAPSPISGTVVRGIETAGPTTISFQVSATACFRCHL